MNIWTTGELRQKIKIYFFHFLHRQHTWTKRCVELLRIKFRDNKKPKETRQVESTWGKGEKRLNRLLSSTLRKKWTKHKVACLSAEVVLNLYIIFIYLKGRVTGREEERREERERNRERDLPFSASLSWFLQLPGWPRLRPGFRNSTTFSRRWQGLSMHYTGNKARSWIQALQHGIPSSGHTASLRFLSHKHLGSVRISEINKQKNTPDFPIWLSLECFQNSINIYQKISHGQIAQCVLLTQMWGVRWSRNALGPRSNEPSLALVLLPFWIGCQWLGLGCSHFFRMPV